MAEPAPIAWADIMAWALLMNVQVQPWEAAALRRLDQIWRSAWRAGQPKQSDKR